MKKIIMALVLSGFVGSVSASKQSLTPQQRAQQIDQQMEQQREQQREQQMEQQREQRQCCRQILNDNQRGFLLRGTLKSLKYFSLFCPQIDQTLEDYYNQNCITEKQRKCCQCIFNAVGGRNTYDQMKARCNKDCDSSIFDSQDSLDTFHKGCRR